MPNEWFRSDRPFKDYPIGTKARSHGGGWWIKTTFGWQWCTGSTFTSPGGDWDGSVKLPEEALIKAHDELLALNPDRRHDDRVADWVIENYTDMVLAKDATIDPDWIAYFWFKVLNSGHSFK